MGTNELSTFYQHKRVLVTGHTGFKGSWLCLWLETLGAEVSGYSLEPPTKPSLFESAGVPRLLRDIRGDLRDYALLARAVAQCRPELIFHLAAQPLVRCSYAQPRETFEVNVLGTVNLLEAARAVKSVKTVVAITSDKCYENREWVHSYRETDPLGGRDPYSASKGAAEIACASYRRSFYDKAGVGLATARAGNVIGGGDWALDRIVPDLVRALGDDVPARVRNPHAVRPWQHVLEPLYGYLLLGRRLYESSGRPGEDNPWAGPWNFGPDPEGCRTVRELADCFIADYGAGSWEDISGQEKDCPREADFLALSTDKARRVLGWSPRLVFQEAVSRTARWYRSFTDGQNALELCRREIDDYQRMC